LINIIIQVAFGVTERRGSGYFTHRNIYGASIDHSYNKGLGIYGRRLHLFGAFSF
jgi:hypothetical protein